MYIFSSISLSFQKLIKYYLLSFDSNDNNAADLHPFTFKFRDEQSSFEEKYQNSHRKVLVRRAQFSLIVSILSYFAFIFLDYLFVPKLINTFLLLRFGVVLPIIVFLLILTTRKRYENKMDIFSSFVILLLGFANIVMIAVGGEIISSTYYTGLILIFIITFTFTEVRFDFAVYSNLTIVVAYEIVSVYMNLPFEVFISNNFFLISALAFNMIVGYSLEYYRRNKFYTDYLLKVKTEKIESNNNELENRVKERTLELFKAKEVAENADKLKSVFLAQMSHEIRTPINSMVSLAQFLKDDIGGELEEDHRLSLEMINNSGHRIVRTVELLLNLSEIQSGTYKPIVQEFDCSVDVIDKVITEYEKFALEKDLKVFVNNQTDCRMLKADHYTVNQIFTQLIDNALKYTDQGKVTINILRNKSEQLVIEIVDTGVGITKDYLPSLFESFTQEEMGYSRKYDGNGIGLSLVKNYCELNNAEIEVESEKDKGTIFRVTFVDTLSESTVDKTAETISVKPQIKIAL